MFENMPTEVQDLVTSHLRFVDFMPLLHSGLGELTKRTLFVLCTSEITFCVHAMFDYDAFNKVSLSDFEENSHYATEYDYFIFVVDTEAFENKLPPSKRVFVFILADFDDLKAIETVYKSLSMALDYELVVYSEDGVYLYGVELNPGAQITFMARVVTFRDLYVKDDGKCSIQLWDVNNLALMPDLSESFLNSIDWYGSSQPMDYMSILNLSKFRNFVPDLNNFKQLTHLSLSTRESLRDLSLPNLSDFTVLMGISDFDQAIEEIYLENFEFPNLANFTMRVDSGYLPLLKNNKFGGSEGLQRVELELHNHTVITKECDLSFILNADELVVHGGDGSVFQYDNYEKLDSMLWSPESFSQLRSSMNFPNLRSLVLTAVDMTLPKINAPVCENLQLIVSDGELDTRVPASSFFPSLNSLALQNPFEDYGDEEVTAKPELTLSPKMKMIFSRVQNVRLENIQIPEDFGKIHFQGLNTLTLVDCYDENGTLELKVNSPYILELQVNSEDPNSELRTIKIWNLRLLGILRIGDSILNNFRGRDFCGKASYRQLDLDTSTDIWTLKPIPAQ